MGIITTTFLVCAEPAAFLQQMDEEVLVAEDLEEALAGVDIDDSDVGLVGDEKELGELIDMAVMGEDVPWYLAYALDDDLLLLYLQGGHPVTH